MKHILSLAAALPLAACAVDAPAVGTVSNSALGGDDCPVLICGNTPYVGAYPFWEVDESGTDYSTNGLRITSVSMGGVQYGVDVDGFQLLGKPFGGGPAVSLVGATIDLELKGSTTTYQLSIAAGTPVHYFEGGDDGTVLPTYRISYREVVDGDMGPLEDLCGTNELSTVARDSLVYQGDRYDPVTGAVIATGAAAGPWVNIACKDDALWKLALFRHVEAASAPGFVTTSGQRTAGLRSIVADYCGTGDSNTKPGADVDWTNAGGWLWRPSYYVVEAVWTESGATCVDEPRVISRDDLACDIPKCNGAGDPSSAFTTYVP
ncbi:MAG: hypothetical protein IPL61_13990 [Myxococcales bacterium]|nr:hypothetical protein [Myxococcales bacterium]